MRKTITLATFRAVERTEEAMLRAMMPRVSAANPEPLTTDIRPAVTERRTWSAGRAYVTKSGFTLAEVCRG